MLLSCHQPILPGKWQNYAHAIKQMELTCWSMAISNGTDTLHRQYQCTVMKEAHGPLPTGPTGRSESLDLSDLAISADVL